MSSDFSDEFPCSGICVIHKISVIHTSVYSFNDQYKLRTLEEMVIEVSTFQRAPEFASPSPSPRKYGLWLPYICAHSYFHMVLLSIIRLGGRLCLTIDPTQFLSNSKPASLQSAGKMLSNSSMNLFPPKSLLNSNPGSTILCCSI